MALIECEGPVLSPKTCNFVWWVCVLLISPARTFAAELLNQLFSSPPPSPSERQRFLWRRNLELRKFINKPSIIFHNRCDPYVLKLNTFSGCPLFATREEEWMNHWLPYQRQTAPLHVIKFSFFFSTFLLFSFFTSSLNYGRVLNDTGLCTQ